MAEEIQDSDLTPLTPDGQVREIKPTGRSCCADVAYTVAKNTAAATNAFDKGEKPTAMHHFDKKAHEQKKKTTSSSSELNEKESCNVM